MTPAVRAGSRFLRVLSLMISAGCAGSDGRPVPRPPVAGVPAEDGQSRDPAHAPVDPAARAAPRTAPETCLGVTDKGVFSDLDPAIQIALPTEVDPARVSARIDEAHNLLVVSID